MSSIPQTDCARLRRGQRGIDKKNLRAAKKFGARTPMECMPNGDPVSKYKHRGIIYIVNDATGEEMKSYAVPIKLDLVSVNEEMVLEHENSCKELQHDLDSWTSNTVLVVDRSGSMREADVWGSRNRLSAVWLAAALDFVANRLEAGEAKSTDVISVITMEEKPMVVLRHEPTTWVLYNKIASIYNSQSIQPRGHGPFLPSLKLSEELLFHNPIASCAVGLLFLSDGRPSDMYETCRTTEDYNERDEFIFEQVEALAKKFGRRLTFQAVGMGDHKFNTLKGMVNAAADYGAKAELCNPSMNTISLGEAFTSVATSVTSTQTELTDTYKLKQTRERTVLRESKTRASTPISTVSLKYFKIYPMRSIQRKVYTEYWEERPNGTMVLQKKLKEMPLQNTEARYVALAKDAFGEGAERFAFRFFELSSDAKTILGRPLVAKESRYVLDDDAKAKDKYVRTFCSTQHLARRLANEFNERLNHLPQVDPKTPRISFLDCSIYKLEDKTLGKLKVLVEEKLDHNKWCKWNSNNGYVEGMKNAPVFSEEGLDNAMSQLAYVGNLHMIIEGSDDDSSNEKDDEVAKCLGKSSSIVFTPFEVTQAFSHYTYIASRMKRLVCDLQGVYDETSNELKLSDPVIHYYNPNRSDRHLVHGKTDRGRKGMGMFFETHKDHCGRLCKLVNGELWNKTLD